MNEYKCDLRSHGTRQVEIKTHYPVPSFTKLKYDLEVYIFTPSQLQLNREKYGVKRFLDDLRTYTRYSTPSILLDRLPDPECDVSPLIRIRKQISDAKIGSDLDQNKLLYELRTLCNVYRVATRDVFNILEGEIESNGDAGLLIKRIELHMEQIDNFLNDMRKLRTELMVPHVSDYLRKAFEWTDESISLNTEIEMYKFHHLLQSHSELANSANMVYQRLTWETEYRQKAGYVSIVNMDNPVDNEMVLYRESILKKWSQAIMYMSTEESKSAVRMTHVFASVAAAAAMAFAVFATIMAGRFFASYSVPWALLIVVSYIFKDRIKEMLRSVLIALLPRLVADEMKRLIDPAVDRTVGTTKGLVRFCRPNDLPVAVNQIRNAAQNPFRSILPAENVIHFHKRIRLNGKLLQKNHTRLESITEVLRIKLDDWIDEMDNPVNSLSLVNEGKIREVEANRVYHIHLIAQLSQAKDTEPSFFHYVLILTQNGLIRIEEHNG
jgi:hypothetical protein